MAVRISAVVQRLQGSVVDAESRPSTIGPITLEVKQTGERSAGNPHAAFDVAGAGNVARSRWCDTRKRKGETTGNTNFDLNWRASPRPYLCGARGETPRAYSADSVVSNIPRARKLSGDKLPSVGTAHARSAEIGRQQAGRGTSRRRTPQDT
jgi:hypothetical protein